MASGIATASGPEMGNVDHSVRHMQSACPPKNACGRYQPDIERVWIHERAWIEDRIRAAERARIDNLAHAESVLPDEERAQTEGEPWPMPPQGGWQGHATWPRCGTRSAADE
jgi:hypothetical protein